jgi:hypothetical protein
MRPIRHAVVSNTAAFFLTRCAARRPAAWRDALATAVSRASASGGGGGGSRRISVDCLPVQSCRRRSARLRAVSSSDAVRGANETETPTRCRSRIAVSNETCARFPRSSSLSRRGLTAAITPAAQWTDRAPCGQHAMLARAGPPLIVSLPCGECPDRQAGGQSLYVCSCQQGRGKAALLVTGTWPRTPNDRQRLFGTDGRSAIAPPGLKPGLF